MNDSHDLSSLWAVVKYSNVDIDTSFTLFVSKLLTRQLFVRCPRVKHVDDLAGKEHRLSQLQEKQQ